ncbi:MAG: TetR/AcrR family transcriptional regulator [Chitinophagaceae bacterium]|nr:TetR/AcrR family transcriptional regulator [Oligoflexus sp.]
MAINKVANTAGSDKAHRILEAAKVLFSTEGLQNTSIEDIATRAGLGKGTVYLYFKSKDEIFSTLASSFAEELQQSLQNACNTAVPAAERLTVFIETRVRFWQRIYKDYELTITSLLETLSNPTAEAVRKRYEASDIGLIKGLLEDGRKNGEFIFDNVDNMAAVLYSMLDSLNKPWGEGELEVTPDEKIKSLSSLLLKGLRSH